MQLQDRLTSAIRSPKQKRSISGKELDLLLLAGCSCLMTILYHPVADTMRSPTAINQAPAAIATQVGRSNQTSPIHLPMPAQRETIRKEEEEA